MGVLLGYLWVQWLWGLQLSVGGLGRNSRLQPSDLQVRKHQLSKLNGAVAGEGGCADVRGQTSILLCHKK